MKNGRWTFMPSSIRSLPSCLRVNLCPIAAWSLACSVQTGREQDRSVLATAIAPYRAMDMAFWLPPAEVALAQVEGQS
jgi:hypothetical protein